MVWRYLEVREREVPRCNAIHAVLAKGINQGITPNTVFLEECPGYVLSLGRNQCPEEEISIDACRALNVKIERRDTGGGAGLMVPGSTSWGVCVDITDPVVTHDMNENMRRLSHGVVRGLQILGLNAYFSEVNDIDVDGKKIGGITALMRGKALLIYGSVLSDFDVDKWTRISRSPPVKLEKKGVSSIRKRVTTLTQELGRSISPSDVRKALIKGYEESLNTTLQKKGLSPAEQEIWKEEINRFSSPDFILRPRHPCRLRLGKYVHPAEKGIIIVSVYLLENKIADIGMSGDFMQISDFDFDELAGSLFGLPAEKEYIYEKVMDFFHTRNVTLLGVTPEDFAHAIMGAVSSFQEAG
ncbi:MAG: lipoate--protein ligase family protein [Theionarchaea archaeon]|nr:lipoate--protein ligase family protein [Theionarchaea archaeon]